MGNRLSSSSDGDGDDNVYQLDARRRERESGSEGRHPSDPTFRPRQATEPYHYPSDDICACDHSVDYHFDSEGCTYDYDVPGFPPVRCGCSQFRSQLGCSR